MRAGGRSRAGTRRARASRRRRRGARGASTCRACAGGCTRAARARPGACPRSCARAGRRCRGSAASGRRRARRVRPRAIAAAWAELVVGEQHLGRGLPVRLLQGAELPLPEERSRVGTASMLRRSRRRARHPTYERAREARRARRRRRTPSGTRRRGTRAPAPPLVRDRAGAQSPRDYAAVRSGGDRARRPPRCADARAREHPVAERLGGSDPRAPPRARSGRLGGGVRRRRGVPLRAPAANRARR